MQNFTWKLRALGIVTIMGLGTLAALHGQGPGGGSEAVKNEVYWKVDPMRGPVDLGLTDPALVDAIDVHEHLGPDAPGTGGQIRALDAFVSSLI